MAEAFPSLAQFSSASLPLLLGSEALPLSCPGWRHYSTSVAGEPKGHGPLGLRIGEEALGSWGPQQPAPAAGCASGLLGSRVVLAG